MCALFFIIAVIFLVIIEHKDDKLRDFIASYKNALEELNAHKKNIIAIEDFLIKQSEKLLVKTQDVVAAHEYMTTIATIDAEEFRTRFQEELRQRRILLTTPRPLEIPKEYQKFF